LNQLARRAAGASVGTGADSGASAIPKDTRARIGIGVFSGYNQGGDTSVVDRVFRDLRVAV
jgi:hypothetical protein